MPVDLALAALADRFGETVEVDDFMTWSEWALARVGFRPSNCLPVVAVCRDELMADFGRAVTDVWGQPFDAGSLAGLVFMGRTGVQAALGHVPGEDGRHRFVVFCFPHIGIDEDGTVGASSAAGCTARRPRAGRWRRSGPSCRTASGQLAIDRDDVEQSLLRMRLQDSSRPARRRAWPISPTLRVGRRSRT